MGRGGGEKKQETAEPSKGYSLSRVSRVRVRVRVTTFLALCVVLSLYGVRGARALPRDRTCKDLHTDGFSVSYGKLGGVWHGDC